MKLLRTPAGYNLYDHKTNDYIHRELRITGILGKIDEYIRNWLSHLQRMPQTIWNHTTTDHKEGEQLEDRRSVDASSWNSGDGTDQRVQSLLVMMMSFRQRYKVEEYYWNLKGDIVWLDKEVCGPGSSVGIATNYWLDGPGSNPGGDEIFRPSSPALGHTQPPVQWVPGLSRGYRRPGRGTDPHPI